MKTFNMIFATLFLAFSVVRGGDYGAYLGPEGLCVFDMKIRIDEETKELKMNEISCDKNKETHEDDNFPWSLQGVDESEGKKISIFFMGSKGRIADTVVFTAYTSDEKIPDDEREELSKDILEDKIELCLPGSGGVKIENDAPEEYNKLVEGAEPCVKLEAYGRVLEVEVMGPHAVAVVEYQQRARQLGDENVNQDKDNKLLIM